MAWVKYGDHRNPKYHAPGRVKKLSRGRTLTQPLCCNGPGWASDEPVTTSENPPDPEMCQLCKRMQSQLSTIARLK